MNTVNRQRKARIAIVIGFFDLFSNYQEVCIAKELARQGHLVHVIAGTYVDRIFSDEMLKRLNTLRRYPEGVQEQEGLRIHRVEPFYNKRSIVLAQGVNLILRQLNPEIILSMMPGQVFSTVFQKPFGARLLSLFADNRAQYFNLHPVLAGFKRLIFYCTKGPFYARLIRMSDAVYASTQTQP